MEQIILKFRQRNINNGQWHYWGLVDNEWIEPLLQDNHWPPEKSNQWTGLPDKNGKEIYEGDVVNCLDTNIRFGQNYKQMEVTFYNGEFGIGDSFGHLGLKHLTEIEVIGSIYEHPQLLTKEKV